MWKLRPHDILLALTVKAVLLLALYLAFFRPELRPAHDAGVTGAAVAGVPTGARP